MIVLELAIDSRLVQVLELVAASQVALLDLVEVPRDEELTRRGHNARLVDAVAIVEAGRREVDALDLVLYYVLRVDGELVSLWLRLGDGLLEATGGIAGRLQDEQVGLAGSEHPLLVLADVDGLDGLAESRQARLRNLAHLLVHADVAVRAAHRKATAQGWADRVEKHVRLVGLRVDDGVAVHTRVHLVHALGLHAVEGAACFLLAVLGIIGDAVEVLAVSAQLLEDLASLEVVDVQLRGVLLVLKDKLPLTVMQE